MPLRSSAGRVLARGEWEPLAAAHAARADAATAGHRGRAARGEKHAVEDFLYDYYQVRPGVLRRWHPGIGVALADAPEHATWKHYARAGDGTVGVDAGAFWAARGGTAEYIATLLRATAERPAFTGCFGMHEWAMVYRSGADTRHPLPLRLGSAGTDAVVEQARLACTHIDAFRFFTPPAMPLNALQLTRADQVEREQPGCLHANMDLYKWASKLAPAVPSELIMDCFELAMEIRYLDMRASAYDCSSLGLDPVPVETAEGKREYAAMQSGFAERAAGLRSRLVAAIDATRAQRAPNASESSGTVASIA